jgi:hypothetical protein
MLSRDFAVKATEHQIARKQTAWDILDSLLQGDHFESGIDAAQFVSLGLDFGSPNVLAFDVLDWQVGLLVAVRVYERQAGDPCHAGEVRQEMRARVSAGSGDDDVMGLRGRHSSSGVHEKPASRAVAWPQNVHFSA